MCTVSNSSMTFRQRVEKLQASAPEEIKERSIAHLTSSNNDWGNGPSWSDIPPWDQGFGNAPWFSNSPGWDNR